MDVVPINFHVYLNYLQVLNEKHKLSNLLEVKGLPEIEEILQETARVKSELKVRTKLNRLQTTKVRIQSWQSQAENKH